MKKETSSSGENTNSSFFRKSEFLDPLVRINRMKFLTSADIGIANQSRFACLDIRQRKVPKLTEIFKPNNPDLPQIPDRETIPVFEVDLQPGQHLREQYFGNLEGYQIVVVLSNSLEIEYP